MDYIIFDLEWSRNVRRVIPKCPDEIIQIGAVKYDKNMNYKGSFNRFITPSVYEGVDAKVAEITGITKRHLERFGVPFVEAFREFKSFMGRDYVLLSWGPQDIQILRTNAQYYNKHTKLNFMYRFADLQKYAAKRLKQDEKQQMGLTTAAALCNISYEEETLHDAHVDAEISGKVFAKVFDKKSLQPYIVNAAERKKQPDKKEETKSDAIDVKKFTFTCPECAEMLTSNKNWFRDTGRFLNLMRCKKCKTELLATVDFFTGKDGKPHYKKRLRKLTKIKNLNTYLKHNEIL